MALAMISWKDLLRLIDRLDLQANSSGIGLVQDVRRIQLHGYGQAHFLNRLGDLGRVSDKPALEKRKTVTPEQFVGLLFGHEIVFSAGKPGCDNGRRLLLIFQNPEELSSFLFERRETVGIPDHGGHGSGGFFGEDVVRECRFARGIRSPLKRPQAP